jgi:hypothetical protein
MHIVRFSLVITLLTGALGCGSTLSPEDAAADARNVAADARANVANADARVTAADARVRVADALVDAANADARVAAAADAAANSIGQVSATSVMIPSGTPLKVTLIDPLDSGTTEISDRFLASLSESVVVNGVTVLAAGTTVRGRVVEVESAGRVQGLARMSLVLTDVVRGAQTFPITTAPLAVTSESTLTRDAGIIAGGAGIGAAIGAIAGGARGAAVGAATGGGAGTGIVLATRGDQVHLISGTRLDFSLSTSVSM